MAKGKSMLLIKATHTTLNKNILESKIKAIQK